MGLCFEGFLEAVCGVHRGFKYAGYMYSVVLSAGNLFFNSTGSCPISGFVTLYNELGHYQGRIQDLGKGGSYFLAAQSADKKCHLAHSAEIFG